MDRRSIFDQSVPQNSPAAQNPEMAAPISGIRENAQADAQQDLQAALQLLANRARYITGAASSVIALGEGDGLICKASSGTMAPAAGTQLQIEGGFTSELMAECVTTRLPVRCNDTENDDRVGNGCWEQGIGSALLAPLIRQNDVVGIFQLTADRKSAFEERDVASLQRLADAVRTALEQTEAANNATDSVVQDSSSTAPTSGPASDKLSSLALRTGRIPLPQNRGSVSSKEDSVRLGGGESLRRCKGCGFPVSPGRTICLDCEAAEIAHGRFSDAPSPLLSYLTPPAKKNWFDEHFYTIGIVLVSVLTLIVLLLWAR